MSNSSNGSNDDDDNNEKISPGRPPKHHKWQKGGPSPNPKGRPRKDPFIPEFKKIFEQAIFKLVRIPRETGPESLTKFTIGMEQLANQFAKGDRYARRDVFEFAQLLGVDLKGEKRVIEDALEQNQQQILDQYFRGLQQQTDPPVDRVIAPPELRDDDVESDE